MSEYDHKIAEKKWQEYWEKNATYKWQGSETRNQKSEKNLSDSRLQTSDTSFVIDTPPPTVSGLLHMGHIFSYTQADFVARYQRMKGKDVFYPMGFDDNGLPTERLVEKTKNIRAVAMPREEFIKQCESVVKDAEEEFRRLFKSAALSVDWSQEYQTISPESRKLSQLSFIDLYNKGEAYRQLQPMLWDPVDQTAIAQAEVEDKEMPSFENYITFGIVDKELSNNSLALPISSWEAAEKVIVMTTRPELLPACVALMCHPDDEERFKDKIAVTPLFNMFVPILADKKVDKEKGTGFVMCCTFGDETDIAWWKTHNINTRIILNKYGKLDETLLRLTLGGSPGLPLVPELTGKKVSNPDLKHPGAREIIIQHLENRGLTSEPKKPIIHAVKCAERSGAPLEFIPTSQWFVKILDKKEALLARARECNWHPEYMRLRLEQWINGLSWDWCISRQRYFGVPFPVWYIDRNPNGGGEIDITIADISQLPVNPLVDLPKGFKGKRSGIEGKYTKDDFLASPPTPAGVAVIYQSPRKEIEAIEIATGKEVLIIADEDVMDTWATSSISPQLSSHAISKELGPDSIRHKALFPADLRPQAHEIIRTWAFYTIVKAHLHENTIPWKNLMISGWCLAADKTKMSKSKGNVVTPVALIEEKGTDAVRYWASTSRLGSDTAFSEDLLKIGRKLVTKLWNAAKFAAIHLQHIKEAPKSAKEDVESGRISEPLDKWILTRLGKAIDKATKNFEDFEYCDARIAAEDFFWNDFCDNYLEMVKARAYDEQKQNPKGQLSAAYTIHHCLDGILRLFAPFIPHITEELYSSIFVEEFKKTGSLHAKGTWPNAKNYPVNEAEEKAGSEAVSILNAVRKLKADQKISLKTPLEVLHIGGEVSPLLKNLEPDLKGVTNAILIKWQQSPDGGYLTVTSDDNKFTLAAKIAKDVAA